LKYWTLLYLDGNWRVGDIGYWTNNTLMMTGVSVILEYWTNNTLMMTGVSAIFEYWTLLYLDDDWRVGDIGILDKHYLDDDWRVGDI